MNKNTIPINKMTIKNILLTGILIIVLASCNQTPKNLKSDPATEPRAVDPVKKTTTSASDSILTNPTNLDPGKLVARWLRSDGGYIIEIFSVTADGKITAGYFNPKPINVEKAEWIVQENRMFVHIILRDVNYPGSQYTLEYSQGNESLTGNYFQAIDGINYDVTFIRDK